MHGAAGEKWGVRTAHAWKSSIDEHKDKGGSAVWHVAGLGQSIKEWSVQEGWNGRPLSQPEARGILVAALGMLAMHYGYLRNHLDR